MLPESERISEKLREYSEIYLFRVGLGLGMGGKGLSRPGYYMPLYVCVYSECCLVWNKKVHCGLAKL